MQYFSIPNSRGPFIQNPNFVPQQLPNVGFQSHSAPIVIEDPLERVDRVAAKAYQDLLVAGESVSAWKVSQATLLALKVDSWSSLGFHLQEVPSLHRLIVTEGKVNAYIHCFVGARRITSLYDLDVAICKNEGVQRFEELRMGPLLRHPLVVHYFSVPLDAEEIVKITSEDLITYLVKYMEGCEDKDIHAEGFLDFIATKRSIASRKKLGVRIQSLRMHIISIREAMSAEDITVKNCLQALKQKPLEKYKKPGRNLVKHSGIYGHKKELDRRFGAISQRVKSFTSLHEDYSGKHVKFISSSSEDEDSYDSGNEDAKDCNDRRSQGKVTSQNTKDHDQCASSCPYPSATEEMSRLGLKPEMDGHPTPNTSGSRCDENKRSFGKKRKFENPSGNAKGSLGKKRKLENPSGNAPHFYNLRKRDKVHQQKYRNKRITVDGKTKVCSLTLSDKSLGKFITTWKEACREQSVAKVFERMLQLYNPPRFRRKKIRSLFSANPFVGLLNVAVASIKHGMWDSLYDAIQSFGLLGQPGSNTPVYPSTESVCIDVDSDGMNAVLNDESNLKPVKSVTVEDIMNKVATYIDLDHASPGEGKSLLQKQLICLRNLCSCEVWLTKEFSVKEFSSLGYGEFLMFLEEYALLLPEKLRMGLLGDLCGRSPFVVSMLQCQLVVLVLQAVSGLQEDKLITKERISLLLQKQFPLISLKIMENGSIEDFLDILRNQKSSFSSSCVLFSATLFETHYCCDSFDQSESGLLESVGLGADIGLRNGTLGSVTSKEAIECLLKAPMLTDLLSWSHWDLLFAPSLGSLVEWLLNEVHIRELLCLVTRNGKVLRIDHLATADAFLEASLQGSSFQSALKLLSLFSIYGGERHVPLSLLKCHARRAIEVIYKNSMESTKENINRIYNMHGKALEERQMLGEDSINNALKVDPPGDTVNVKASKDKYGINPAASVVLRFVLDSLCYLPSEFQSFAADVFLSGLQSVIKNAPSALLSKCNRPEQRLMLHEVGLTLGITEWIEDCRAFYSTAGAELSVASESLNLKDGTPTFSMNSECVPDASENLPSFERKVDIYFEADRHNEIFNKGCNEMNSETVSGEKIDNDCMQCSSELHEYQDAAHVIESIRREEFGLDPNLTIAETSMLSKQHARLGRALHCLSQELYSQDSHFILELVQNADDNIYPENVEPTLIFILESSGIVVLNNEQGFSAHNIRALCDVGNSTKKGSSAGYIGRKGIGFKSVFRVTDAPEIHSNGYHVKFDISEGQIGFVLPIVVPPRDIEGLSRLVSSEYDQTDDNRWNTCIVLPFRSKLTELLGVNSILSMFSDLHPSLLLFLHRLQCIKFRSILNGSFTVMRKEILGDGIVRISCGEEKMSWFVASKKLQATAIRPDVQTTEIAIAFTLQELDTGELKPRLDQQPVFAFLPLRRYGLKFILQGDFVLPSSREEVDGDSAWNQWLLSEIPGLFFSAEMSFCALACFQENPGKAVAAYMSFVPLMGEVHGFFSNLPRMIISKLRMSNCLLLEGDSKEWVPPSRVLRNWSEQARILLPQSLLHEHLGLGYLKKEILLSDSLAKALGVEEYGPKVLIDFAACACQKENGIKSLGLGWLSSWLCTLYALSFYYSGTSVSAEIELDLLDKLRKIPIIPLSDGTYASLADGTIWLAAESFSSGFEQENGAEAFPCLYSKLRTVSPALLSAAAAEASSMSGSMVENLTRMLHIIGVQQLSAHEIIRVHILRAMSDDRIIAMDRNLYIEYISFVMFHLHSSCSSCHTGKEFLISDIQKKALILTNHGYKRPAEESIHFSKDFGNPVDLSRLFDDNVTDWHEVDTVYLKHPCTKLLSHGLKKWREFFQMLGVTDFVQVLQIERNLVDASSTVLKNMMWDRDLISPGVLVRDWESPELLHLLTILSSNKNQEQCKYLLEVLDNLWDDCFSAKVTGYCMVKSTDESKPMSSSFINCICDIQWVVSSVDNQLHYPKDLFYDCEAVRSILGTSAPYAVPKVRSINLSRDIGFKTQVTLDDALAIVQVWRRSESPFSASVTQMSKFYTFIWNHMAISKVKIAEVFRSGPYIFVPFSNSYRHEDVVSGGFFSADEVYWHDPTGSVDQIKKLYIQCAAINRSSSALSNTVASVYPGLHEFFVNECGVHEIPPFACYIQILQQLSSISLPSQTANRVFRVFSKWANDLKSGLVGSEDTDYLKNRLLEIDCTVLPTVQDKWVSLHPSFGLVCWCDDEELRKQFKYCDSIDFLYFGELSNEEKEILQAKVVSLMRKIGIPALSEVITREAIFYGTEDCSDKASLVNWILPYAQRYIYKLHPDIYLQLKQSGFGKLNDLRIVVVEKLFYRHIIKGSNNVSKKQFVCSCLIQDNILYMTGASDFHSIYMELSRLFFDGTPELHLANFLHMITTMAESGSNEEQTEVFILNSQKLPKLPDEESVWFLSLLQENGEIPRTTCASMINDDQNSSKAKRKPRINPNWPPVDWKTAPDFNFARTNHFRRRPGGLTPTGSLEGEHHMITSTLTDGASSVIGVDVDWFSHDDLPGTSMGLALQESRTKEDQPLWMGNSGPSRWDKSRLDLFTSAVDSGSGARVHDTGFFSFNVSDQLSFGTLNENQAAVTGRLGELIAFKYLCEKAGMVNVKWVNEEMETGLPYDLVIGGEDSREYVEVKTTKSKNKNWFKISTREWQEAAAKGESFSILHVVLMGQKNAKISLFKNPASLCQQGLLHLAVLMPTQDR